MICCGIDPGGTTGLVAIALPANTYRLVDARLVGFAHVTAGSSSTESKANVKARLFDKIRAQLRAWRAEIVVIEEPWDALPTWGTRLGSKADTSALSVRQLAEGVQGKPAARGGGASRGTIFHLGAAYGLALAAAVDHPWDVTVVSYPMTSAPAKGRKPERVGWMQRRQPRPPSHTQTALECAMNLRALKSRPLDGVLPTPAQLATEENDNVYMALGVLSFWLDRQRGIV
jgi:hypothetical protein